jgi:L-threonylcarbamoyladenylate synthase
MKYFTEKTDPELIDEIKNGAIGVLRTDTLYGVVAKASDETAVDRVFAVRARDKTKACIVLIGDIADLFDTPDDVLTEFIQSHWPGPVSIAIPSPSAPDYLKFHDGTVAYRLPADSQLRELLKATGPLIAPSANTQGESPASNIQEAEEYFDAQVDFYVDSGNASNMMPSQLWTYKEGKMERIR